MNRRQFITSAVAAIGGSLSAMDPARSGEARTGPAARARVAITFDLEMSRNFPRPEDTHWDCQKGNLDDATKAYAVKSARIVKEHGGLMHFFLLGSTLEQDNVDWLYELIAGGHRIGNHTYDHINLKAMRIEELQPRFTRAPWLVAGRPLGAVIEDNIRKTSAAIQERLGITAYGFRSPHGYTTGLADRFDLQQMLLQHGFRWVSSKYPVRPAIRPNERPSRDLLNRLRAAQEQARPFAYQSGLIEVPMNLMSDIDAFRNARWKLGDFLDFIEAGVESAIQARTTFDFIAHPSCLGVIDPRARAIELICKLVTRAGSAAEFSDLEVIASGVQT